MNDEDARQIRIFVKKWYPIIWPGDRSTKSISSRLLEFVQKFFENNPNYLDAIDRSGLPSPVDDVIVRRYLGTQNNISSDRLNKVSELFLHYISSHLLRIQSTVTVSEEASSDFKIVAAILSKLRLDMPEIWSPDTGGANVSVHSPGSQCLPHALVSDAHSSVPHSSAFLEAFVKFLTRESRTLEGRLKTGVYQYFRRYKPLPDEIDLNQDEPNHIVIAELIYVNAETKECLVVTSARNIYYGTMFLNHKNILHCLLQRPDKYTTDTNIRIYSLKLHGRSLAFYSGICLKTGDTTLRPISSECIFVPLAPEKHKSVIGRMEEIFAAQKSQIEKKGGQIPQSAASTRLDEDDIVCDYFSDTPPDVKIDIESLAWERVRRAKEIPFLFELSKKRRNSTALLREPSRALRRSTIVKFARDHKIYVFRQSENI